MEEALTDFDFVLLGIVALVIIFGLLRGLSGEVGTLIGIAAGIMAFPVLMPLSESLAAKVPYAFVLSHAAALTINAVLALVVFGIVRRIAARFLAVVLPQPLNAILGATAGLLKGIVLLVVISLSGLLFSDTCSDGIAANHSRLIRFVSGWVDRWIAPGDAET